MAATPGVSVAAAGQTESVASQTDRLIIKYKDAKPAGMSAAMVPAMTQSRAAILTRSGQQFGLTMKTLHSTATGANVVHLGKKMSLADAAAVARDLKSRDASIEYAEPDRMLHKLMTPNDTRYKEQWNYFEANGGLRANAAWDKASGSGQVVAVIDTGFRPHADLAGQFLPGYDFISDATTAGDGNGRDSDASDAGDWTAAEQCEPGWKKEDSSWHGTHVAGTIAGKTGNNLGVAGIAFNAKILPLRVLGHCGGYTSDIADAIIWASGGAVTGVPTNPNPARVINMSLGGPGACDTTSQNAINIARSRGTVVVVAAGNENADASTSNPANCAGVIAVAAVDRTGGRAWYSNYGNVVSVAAPGGDTSVMADGILSTLNAGLTTPGADSYAFYQGTSMATPHVAGVVALMLSANPSLTVDQVTTRLKSSTRPFVGSCVGCGTGIVDALAAVNAAIGIIDPPPGNSETESNNTLATANAVTLSGSVMNGNMGSSSDTDYFVVQLPAGKTLTSTLTPNSTSDYDLYVYNSNGSQIASSEKGTGAVDSAAVTNTGTTTIARYVRVKYYTGGMGATSGKYTLKLSW